VLKVLADFWHNKRCGNRHARAQLAGDYTTEHSAQAPDLDAGAQVPRLGCPVTLELLVAADEEHLS
jgi:hypothetical protein